MYAGLRVLRGKDVVFARSEREILAVSRDGERSGGANAPKSDFLGVRTIRIARLQAHLLALCDQVRNSFLFARSARAAACVRVGGKLLNVGQQAAGVMLERAAEGGPEKVEAATQAVHAVRAVLNSRMDARKE